MRAAPRVTTATVTTVAVVTLGVGLVGLVASLRLSPPADLGRWGPAALSGEAVLALADRPDGVLVGTSTGLLHLATDGTVVDLGVPGPARALAEHAGGTFVGTDAGLLDLPDAPAGRAVGSAITVLPDTAVSDVHVGQDWAGRDLVVVGGATGVLARTGTGGWEQLWPTAAARPDDGTDAGTASAQVSVPAVLTTGAGVLFAHPDGLALLSGTGRLDLVVRDVAVVELHADARAGLAWAGTRGGPLLLATEDGGRTWRPRAGGLGLSAVETLVRPPGDGDALVAGGSGLADGTGNAGTETSTDQGRLWRTEQDRLSNTHVYDLIARREAWPLELRLLGTDARLVLPLPVVTTRLYAGTNGGGVSTRRPGVPVLAALAPAAPLLRLLEPLLLGGLLLVCLLPAYRFLWRGGTRATPRPPPVARVPPADGRRADAPRADAPPRDAPTADAPPTHVRPNPHPNHEEIR